jgi:hypothetical protein
VFAEAAAARAVGLEELDGVSKCMWGAPKKASAMTCSRACRASSYAACLPARRGPLPRPEQAAPPTVEALALPGVPEDQMLRVLAGSPAYRCQTLRAATTLFPASTARYRMAPSKVTRK